MVRQSLNQDYALADIIAIRSSSLFARLILRWTNNTVSHVGLVISVEPLLVLEALTRVRTRPLWTMVADCERLYVIHHRRLSREERVRIIEEACLWSALSYGYGKIALQGLDLLTHTSWFSRTLGRSDQPYCSFFVSRAFAVLKILFGVKTYRSIRPDEILSWCEQHPDLYTVSRMDLVKPGDLS